MPVESKNGKSTAEVVEAAIKAHGASHDELIPILLDVNRSLGYLPAEALEDISRQLKVPKSQLYSVASFYQMLSTRPRGRHIIQYCESAPCHVVGGRQVWEALQNELHLNANETSPDGKWTLVTVSCLGICGVGPVVIIDDDVYGNVDPAKVPEILARYS